jgi:8-oxo-dGTP pyrophosphatase MutT (NUDIX family)
MLGAASVVLDDRSRVLLVKHGYGELNWEIPGGAGEPGESAEETALREAREEAGIELQIERLAGVYWEPRADAHHFVFRARTVDEPRVADAKEITAFGWFARDALPLPISDFTIRRIDDALSDGPAALTAIGPRVWMR